MSEQDKKPEPITLLLIDDEHEFVDVLSKRLFKRNIQATKAYTGKEGIQALRNQSFQIAVLDLKMGDMNGIEVLKILKIIDPNMPVIMLTGHGSQQAAQEGLEAGASDYLTKPYDLAELVGKIYNLVGRPAPEID